MLIFPFAEPSDPAPISYHFVMKMSLGHFMARLLPEPATLCRGLSITHK
jgi:hypothetical protein